MNEITCSTSSRRKPGWQFTAGSTYRRVGKPCLKGTEFSFFLICLEMFLVDKTSLISKCAALEMKFDYRTWFSQSMRTRWQCNCDFHLIPNFCEGLILVFFKSYEHFDFPKQNRLFLTILISIWKEWNFKLTFSTISFLENSISCKVLKI